MSDEQKLDVVVDLDALTLGDLEVLEASRDTKTANLTKLLDVLDRVVVGGARHLPYKAMNQIVEAINEAVGRASNPT